MFGRGSLFVREILYGMRWGEHQVRLHFVEVLSRGRGWDWEGVSPPDSTPLLPSLVIQDHRYSIPHPHLRRYI